MSDPADRTKAFTYAWARNCPDCHGPLTYNHDLYCPGPRQVVAPWPPDPEPACECVGAFHEHGCPIAYWPEPA